MSKRKYERGETPIDRFAAMADETDADEDAALDLIAQTVAHEVMMALQSDLAEISMYARAGCTPGETRAAVARDRRAN